MSSILTRVPRSLAAIGTMLVLLLVLAACGASPTPDASGPDAPLDALADVPPDPGQAPDMPAVDAPWWDHGTGGDAEAFACPDEEGAGSGAGGTPDGFAACMPNCPYRDGACGSDGCGGVCGVCDDGQTCGADGRCEPCVPACAGRECGPDGCGGSCGGLGRRSLGGGGCADDATCVETATTAACRSTGPGSPLWSLPDVMAIGQPALTPDGKIVVVGYDNRVRAIQPAQGVVWEAPLPQQSQGAPVVGPDGTVYVADLGGTLHALAADGTPEWHATLPGYATGSVGLDAAGTLYLATTEETQACGRNRYVIRLHALAPDGSLRWSRVLWDRLGWLPVGGFAVGADGTVYVTRDEYTLEALTPDGEVAWTWTDPFERPLEGVPSLDPARGLLVSAGSDLVALTLAGTFRWEAQTGWPPPDAGAPAIAADGSAWVPASALVRVDAQGHATGRSDDGGGARTPSLATDGRVYGLSPGRVVALLPDLTLAWSVRFDDLGLAPPLLAPDGTLYVVADGLYALDTGGAGLCEACPWPMHQHDVAHTNRAGTTP